MSRSGRPGGECMAAGHALVMWVALGGGAAITSPIAGTVLAAAEFSGAGARPKPGTCQVRSAQPAGGQAADSFRGAFERGVGIAAADP
eukprot:scaffold109669_cov60-Phaeocystis_antarctica.AAC.1